MWVTSKDTYEMALSWSLGFVLIQRNLSKFPSDLQKGEAERLCAPPHSPCATSACAIGSLSCGTG